jgi:DNA-binding CsgD family transcriptional regulator
VISGIMYITGIEFYFNMLWQVRTYQIQTLSRGRLYHVELSSLVTNIGIIGVMTGFVYFTSHYLQLRYYLPLWNKWLRVGVWALVALVVVSDGLTFTGIYYLDTIIYQNILILLIILGILSSGILTYRKGYKPAKYFLIANTIPLCLMMGLAIYFNLNHSDRNISFFSNLAIIFQALALAIALVARINLLKEELKQKQLDVQIFQNEYEQMVARSQFIALENEYILAEIALKQNEKEELQAKLEANQRELASNALYIYQKNELLIELKKQIEHLSTESNQPKEMFREIKSMIQNNIHLEADWEKFKIHFEQVNPTFFQELSAKCPDLTAYEIRLSAYLHLNMTSKEIATLLNINPESVYKAKTRLNKKLGKNNGENLM